MHPKNTTTPSPAQSLTTKEVGFFDTPIDNKGEMMFSVTSGLAAEDALHAAKVLSAGLGQICNHLHDSLNMGEMAYCDGVKALAFLAETVSALVWSVERGLPKAEGEDEQ